MHPSCKNTTGSKVKIVILLFVICCAPIKTLAQDFKWLYTTKSAATQTMSEAPLTGMIAMVTNNNNEIYAIGESYGDHDFGDGQRPDLNDVVPSSFIVKMDKDKNILWVKQLIYDAEYIARSIIIDNSGNLFIGGDATTNGTILYLDPNPLGSGSSPIFRPTHQNLKRHTLYGFMLKLDAQGNYINAVVFEGFAINDIAKDNNNGIIAVGGGQRLESNGYVAKLDNSLTTVWDKIFVSQGSGSGNRFGHVACDSQGTAYIHGAYRKNFTFGNTTLQKAGDDPSHFICKMSPSGTEQWLIEMDDQNVKDIKTDALDNIYFISSYREPGSIQFNNTVINNLPVLADWETVLFKMDANANHLWNTPIYGTGQELESNFVINSLGELLVSVESNLNAELHFAYSGTTIAMENSSAVLLKIDPTGALVDYKRMYQQAKNYGWVLLITHIDLDDNIFLGGLFRGIVDFDPDLTKEHIVATPLYHGVNASGPYTEHEGVGFILKLAYCDADPLFGSTYDFCQAEHPNPTVANIKPSILNVRWYASPSSVTPLTPGTAVTDGQTFYYENIVQSCPSLGRTPIQIRILPPDVPAVIGAVQPCYFQGMKLSDLNISGQNLVFYPNATTTDPVASSTVITPGVVYYVTQRTAKCESTRIPVSVTDYFGSMPTAQQISFCDDNTSRKIDLSDYNNLFIAANTSQSDYTFSYHKSAGDATANLAPIINYQNYPMTPQTVYVRMYFHLQSCVRVVGLTMELFTPPVIDQVKIEDLVSNNSITVLPYNPNYMYSLDGISFQQSNYFGNLSAGEYNVQIRIADCMGPPKKVLVLEYPKFFTPNGDGINDTWKVKYSQLQFSFNIEIFDRFGRIVASLNKSTAGWDGKSKGLALPSTDYWFRIIRVANQETVYTGHFSLKR